VITAGLIGGIAPESTIQYYRLILASYRERAGAGAQPSLIVNSIDLHRMLGDIAAGELERVTAYLAGEIERLERAGATFGLLAANTPHVVFDAIQSRVKLPLISIVDVTLAAARERGFKRVALFGTRFTMEGRFYPEVFEKGGIEIVPPNDAERAFIHEKYVGELVNAVFLESTRARLLEIMRVMKTRDRIDAVILGGTELPLLLDDESIAPVPFLDTTRIHVAEVVNRLLGAPAEAR
jgi:aspartate racemase